MPAIKTPDISVVVPVYNEQDNVGPLAREIHAALGGSAYEMIFVNDCSSDETLTRLKALKTELPALRAITHNRNAGQSRSVRTYGRSKYTNLGRLWVSIADLRGVLWVKKRARNPQGYEEE